VIAQLALDDLRWLLLAPPLLNPAHPRFNGCVFEFSVQQRNHIEQWLDQLGKDPQPLLDWLAAKSERHLARLGRYAEQLLEFFLRHGPTHRLVAANIALRVAAGQRQGDHTTVGEIDYLLEDLAGQRWHWELAVKYFLCCDVAVPSTSHLIGPDAAETFDSKLNKIFGRQLRHGLPAPYDQHVWKPAAFTRGWMFYPAGAAQLTVDELHTDHLRGCWLTLEQVQRGIEGEQFLILDRQRWLASAKHALTSRLITYNAHTLAQEIERRWCDGYASGVLVAQLHRNGDHAVETNRFFVVPNAWPKNPNKPLANIVQK
jgi:uncharacterized protein